MKTTLSVFALVLAIVPAVSPAQSFYVVTKNQQFLQTSAVGAVADPLGAFKFQAKAATNVTLALPGGGTLPLEFDNRNSDYALRQWFGSKAAMDAAFPNGTYLMTGTSIPALSINLAADNYPVVTPQVTSVNNGTWNSDLLVVNPAQATTINFSTFSGYATSGLAGHINFSLVSMTDDGSNRVDISTEIFSRPISGQPATPTPLTAYTIPAGKLVSGRVYRAWLDFDTIITMDTTTVAGAPVGTLFSKGVTFYIGAQNPGTSTPPPVIVGPPTNRAAFIGESVTISADVTIGGTLFSFQNGTNFPPVGYNWSHHGKNLDLGDSRVSGIKYTNTTNGIGLTINALTAADAGDYTVTIFTAGGVVMSAPATLTLTTPIPPVITSQPQGATVNTGATLALTVAATGTPTPTYQWRKDGVPVAGAMSTTLVLANIAASAAGNYTVVATNPAGSVMSNVAAVTVTSGPSSTAPVITSQPQGATVNASSTLALTVAATGTPTPTYQWRKDGVAISGATSNTLVLPSATSSAAGNYTVVVSNSLGAITSNSATVSVTTESAPVFATQPLGVTVNAGSTVALSATATGSPTPNYQWRKDGEAISGATSSTLVLPSATSSTAGNYTVVVSNFLGAVTSNSATVSVTSGQPSRLPNLSVRTNLGTSQTLIVGFATIGSKNMLVRGVGPGLSGFGLSTFLPDPTIELYNTTSAKIDENNDWSPALTSVFANVGAFGLAGGSKDAALQRACNGANTAQIKSVGTGVVLVEVYDTGGPGKLVNVSARNVVGTGGNILITGFVVDGTAAKTLLIRGVGAKLTEFGVIGVLADPKLEIYNAAGVKIAENDNWNAQLQTIARSVGAFDLTLGSRDAALLLTLAPGNYTAQISGISGTTGEAIVEVYDVP